MAAPKRLIDHAAVAEWLGVTERHVRQLVTDRRIPFVKIGHQTTRFDPDEIEQWLAEKRRDAVS
jgi:excisionase family DNA binding protein